MADYELPPGCRELPNGEVVLKPFFILDEHSFLNDKGEKIVLDRERLQRIANNANIRLQSPHPDECPIIVGHTADGLEEKFQPDIVGWARDWKVLPFKNGKYAIQVTPVAKDRNSVEAFKKFVRRSVEYWSDTDEVDPIALLGASTPKRDLGTYRLARKFSRRGQIPYHYSCTGPNMFPNKMDAADPSMDNPDEKADQSLLAQFFQSSDWKEMKAKIDQVCSAMNAQQNPMPEDPNAMPPEGMPPEGMGQDPNMPPMDMNDGNPLTPEEDDDEEHPRKTEMSMKYSRRRQAFAKDYDEGKADWRAYLALHETGYFGDPDAEIQEPQRMSKKKPVSEPPPEKIAVDRATKLRFERLEKESKATKMAMQKEIDDLKKLNLVTEITNDLQLLEQVDRIDFDFDEELTTMLDLPNKKARDGHVEKMKKRYQRLPPTSFDMQHAELRPVRMNKKEQPDPNAVQNPEEGVSAAILLAEAMNKGKDLTQDEAVKMARRATNGNGKGITIKTR